jgi:hypothetical protein
VTKVPREAKSKTDDEDEPDTAPDPDIEPELFAHVQFVEISNTEDPMHAMLAAQVSGCSSRSYPNIKFRRLLRVVSPALLRGFEEYRQTLPEEARDIMLFFHGTDSKNIDPICSAGWSLSLAGSKHGAVWGKGIYASCDLKTALGYSPSTRASLSTEFRTPIQTAHSAAIQTAHSAAIQTAHSTAIQTVHSAASAIATIASTTAAANTTVPSSETLTTAAIAASASASANAAPNAPTTAGETLRRTVLLGRACPGKVHRADSTTQLSRSSTITSFARKAADKRLPSGCHSMQAKDSTRVFFDERQIIPAYVIEIEYDVPWDRM